MNHQKLRYVVNPRTPVLKTEYSSRVMLSEFLCKPTTFWDFLLLGFIDQLKIIAYKFLTQKKDIQRVKIKQPTGVEFETIDLSDKDLRSLILKEVDLYFNFNGKPPKIIFIGNKYYKTLRYELMTEYEYMVAFPKFKSGQEHCADPVKNYFERCLVSTKLVISPYLDGIFLWGGEE